MNEEFAIDPEACESGAEFKFLLGQFGPLVGRYAARFPGSWMARTAEIVDKWPDGLSKVAARQALLRAKESGAFVRSGGRDWAPALDWPDNVRAVQRSKAPFDGVVARRALADEYPTLETFEPRPSGEAFVEPTARGLAEPARQLIEMGPEIALADPYFDPSREGNAAVLRALLAYAATSRSCASFCIWTLSKHVLERNSRADLERALEVASKASGFYPRPIAICLVDEPSLYAHEGLRIRFHSRYLVTMRGALRYDAGFRAEGRGRVEVSVVGPGTHAELVSLFLGSAEPQRRPIEIRE